MTNMTQTSREAFEVSIWQPDTVDNMCWKVWQAATAAALERAAQECESYLYNECDTDPGAIWIRNRIRQLIKEQSND